MHPDDEVPALPFLSIDPRLPRPLGDLLKEADGCLAMTFLVGGAACGQKASQALLASEQVTGSQHQARVRQLADKYPFVSRGLFGIVANLGDVDEPLDVDRLRLLIVALKAIAYEIYVLGPERCERLSYVQELLHLVEGGGGLLHASGAALAETPPD